MNNSPLKTKITAIACGVLSAFTLLMVPCTPAGAQEVSDGLGRLFFTPERRQTLDRQRQLNIQEKQEIPEDPTLTINGIVTRSSGKRTAWINGVSQNENDIASGVAVIPNRKDNTKITVKPHDSQATDTKVGNTVNRNSGDAVDLLNGGTITLNPPRKASGK
ncbi:MAG: hypothetical protein WCL27_01895 [Betaproteobacteria bacterium]